MLQRPLSIDQFQADNIKSRTLIINQTRIQIALTKNRGQKR